MFPVIFMTGIVTPVMFGQRYARTSPVQPQKFCNFIAMEHFIYLAVLLMMGKMEIMGIGILNSTQRVFLAFIPDLRQYSLSLVRF